MKPSRLQIILLRLLRTVRRIVQFIVPKTRKIMWRFGKIAIIWAMAARFYGPSAFTFWRLAILLFISICIYFKLTFASFQYAWWFTKHTFGRDVRAVFMYIKMKLAIGKAMRRNIAVPKYFKSLVDKHPDKICYYGEEKDWTYREVDEYSNRIANLFYEAGYRHGDTVALLMENQPEFVCIWLGLGKLGVCTALLNYNQRMETLVHSITTGESKAVIFENSYSGVVNEIHNSLPENMKFYSFGDAPDFVRPSTELKSAVAKASPGVPPKVTINVTDKLILIYTSGTTGLPKAAIITNARYIFMAVGGFYSFFLRHEDTHYDPLPLYHSAGGILGAGQALLSGIPVVIRKKFSASRFWDDCIKYNCTVSQYIGETCRYLLAQPPRPQDRMHKVRVMFGNGLRPQIWQNFVDRFGIEHVAELYGATEGNANIVNTDSKPGACGFVSRVAPFIYPVALIRVDEDTGIPLRSKNGLCIRCGPGQPGEFVGKIIRNDPIREFTGYVGQDVNKRVVRDVFSKGDMAFLSGDILEMDELGYVYFKDRTGDTFRWKGENVSTQEVEGVVSNAVGLKDCTVFGVEVAGNEGRAGMAAILDPDHTVDLEKMSAQLAKSLPLYARPMFVRIADSLPMTSTYKLKKTELQIDGFDPSKAANDRLYYLKASTGQYLDLDVVTYNDIISGKIRL